MGEGSEMATTCISPMQKFQQHSNSLPNHLPATGWQFNGAMKQEPLDEARNDSGVTSGSDCPSASPGSDRSDNHQYQAQDSNMAESAMKHMYLNTQVPYQTWYRNNFVDSPVTPTNRNNMVKSPTTPTTSKLSESTNDEVMSPAGYQNTLSPKVESSDENSVEYDDQGIRVPKVNSHGKIKVHKCKQCDFVAYTKIDYWRHTQTHIKDDKKLHCPKCPFVTEYKHHLEYHLLNHVGAKPYKCDHCDYSCVNKSMLNSHLKSHSKVYQYRCSDCLYETKYCHSLKLHLRKYKHKPAMVLNPDGSPNPLPIIDVYGTRRGPKVKKVSESSGSYPATPAPQSTDQQPQIPFNPLINPLLQQNPMFPFQLPLMPGVMPNPELLESFQKMIRERLAHLALQNQQEQQENNQEQQETNQQQEEGVLDLSSANNPASHTSDDVEYDDEEMTTAFANVEVVESRELERRATPENQVTEPTSESNNNINASGKHNFACQYCGISFEEEVMFRIHMGYHGYSYPFTCNMCGEQCENKVNFFLHIARAAH